MTEIIAWASLIAGTITFTLGVIEWFSNRSSKERIKGATDNAADVAKDQNSSTENLSRHASVDFKAQWEALAALAKALKDLDSSTRMMVLTLAFYGIAGATTGLQVIGEGLGAN